MDNFNKLDTTKKRINKLDDISEITQNATKTDKKYKGKLRDIKNRFKYLICMFN